MTMDAPVTAASGRPLVGVPGGAVTGPARA